MFAASRRTLIAALLVPFALACMKKADDTKGAGETTRAAAAPTTITKPQLVISGFHHPESVRYDPDQDLYFVSNIDGDPPAKDGKGEIAKMQVDGTLDMTFIVSGKNGVMLNAPKGLAIVGDTLWVTDIDVVRGFNRKTGKPVATIDLSKRPSRFLNDVAAAPDGSLYITDSGIKGQGADTAAMAILHIVGRKVTVVAHGAALAQPNGVTWDAANSQLLEAGLGSGDVFAIGANDSTLTKIGTGPGGYDGLEVVMDSMIVVTSWADSSVGIMKNGRYVPYILNVTSPADIGIDTKRGTIAVPRLMKDEVDLFATTHPAGAMPASDTAKR